MMKIFTSFDSKRILYYLLAVIILAAVLPACKSSKKKRRRSSYTKTNPYKTKPRPTSSSSSSTTNTNSNSSTSTPPKPTNSNSSSSSSSGTAMKREAKISKMLSTADSYLGTKHKMGGLSKSGIDCSGLVQLSYKSINVSLPRSTSTQISSGKEVKMSEVKKGDLVFFTYPGGTRVTHVGIIHQVNNSSDVVFIHTSSSRGVRKDNLYSDYWKKLFITARRVL